MHFLSIATLVCLGCWTAFADETKSNSQATSATVADESTTSRKPSEEPPGTTESTTTASPASDEYETTVTARKPVTAAGSTTIRDRDLKLRPIYRPADVLQVTPGLYVTQHAGGGKANQYFLRGYDADHGTDLALYVDGIPVNLVSHGHGQGYADLHWLILETVERVEVLKGTYFPQLGNFATAGGINIITRKTQDKSQIGATVGMYGNARVYAMTPEKFLGLTPLIAAEVFNNDGPFLRPEKTRRYNYFAKFTKDFSASSALTFGTAGYGGRWNASGQIPNRAVQAGPLNRFGSIDPTEGGDSDRYSLFAHYNWAVSENSKLRASTYFNYYRLSLYSNFTFFSDDAVNGDQINQLDNRTTAGGDVNYRFNSKWGDYSLETLVGFQGRNDNITNSLHKTKARQFLSSVRDNDVNQSSLAVYANEEVTWAPWLRSHLGMRGDYYFFKVTDRATGAPLGSKDSGILSPKASLIFTPLKDTDVFVNYGQGFHSNDARGLFNATPAKPLNKVYGYELGSRTRLLEGRLDLALAGFLQYSDDELVFSGDSGGTESVGASRRFGVELEARFRILEWLLADADLNLVKPEIRGKAAAENAIPNAPTRIITGGVTAQHPQGYFGRFGFFHIGDRPLVEDRFIQGPGFIRFDATVGFKQKSFEVSVGIQNVFNTKWNEAQFGTTSRLPGEMATNCPAGTRPKNDDTGTFKGCQDLHFTPGNPLNVQANATFFL